MSCHNLSFSFFSLHILHFMKFLLTGKSKVSDRILLTFQPQPGCFLFLYYLINNVLVNSNAIINYLEQIIVVLVMVWFFFFLSFFLYKYSRTHVFEIKVLPPCELCGLMHVTKMYYKLQSKNLVVDRWVFFLK